MMEGTQLNDLMKCPTNDLQEAIKNVTNLLFLFSEGDTANLEIVQDSSTKEWSIKSGTGRNPKQIANYDTEDLDTMLNRASHSVVHKIVERVNLILQKVGLEQIICFEKKSKKWVKSIREKSFNMQSLGSALEDTHSEEGLEGRKRDKEVASTKVVDKMLSTEDNAEAHLDDNNLPFDSARDSEESHSEEGLEGRKRDKEVASSKVVDKMLSTEDNAEHLDDDNNLSFDSGRDSEDSREVALFDHKCISIEDNTEASFDDLLSDTQVFSTLFGVHFLKAKATSPSTQEEEKPRGRCQ